jgi:tetratricopeptide (TPR) repeat protein
MLEEGDQIREFRLKRLVGSGSYGEVWLAEKQIELADEGIPFALKFLINETHKGVNSEMVRNEVRTWIRAGNHANIVPVYDGFAHGRYLVIVSEYLEGGSLRDWLESNEKRAPSLENALHMMRGILRGLAHLHSRNIIHRDLKPENILLKNESPHITDFGVARIVETFSQSAHQRYTMGAGAPLYMPPEAFSEGQLTRQLDTWSAGIIFYEMLSGEYPFNASTVSALYGEILNREPRPLPPEVPVELCEVVSKSLVKDVSGRFQTADEMSDSLERAWSELEQHRKWRLATLDRESGPKKEEELTEAVKSSRAYREEQYQGREATVGEIKTQSVDRFANNEGKLEELGRTNEAHQPQEIKRKAARWDRTKKLALAGIAVAALAIFGILKFDKIVRTFSGRSVSIASLPNQPPVAAPMTADSYFVLGKECAQKKDYDCSIDYYTRAIELNPRYVAAFINRGNAFDDKGDYDRAIKDYDSAIELSPDEADAFNNRGLAYYDKGEYSKAIKDFNRSIVLDQRNSAAFKNRGDAYYEQGNKTQAMKDFYKALELDPKYGGAHTSVGFFYLEQGKIERAIKEFDLAIALDPTSGRAYYNRGNAYYDSGDLEKAIKDYDKAIELRPKHASSFTNRGTAYLDNGNLDQAIADFTESIRLNAAELHLPYNSRGLAYFRKGQHADAIRDFDKAIESNPKYAKAYLNRAIAYQGLGLTDKAKTDRLKYDELSRKK